MKSGNLNTRNLETLRTLQRLFSTDEVFLFHTSVRWLLKGNFLRHVFEAERRNKLFSELKTNEVVSYTSHKIWLKSLAYLAEIFEKVNNSNQKIQENGTNITQLRDESASILFVFAKQGRKAIQGNVAMFEKLSNVVA